MCSELERQLVIERYKFIQDKIKHLDNVLHSNISDFIKILMAILTLVSGAFVLHVKEVTMISEQGLLILIRFSSGAIVFVSASYLLMTIANLFSWIDYRKDEVKLLMQFGGSLQRNNPRIKSFLAWQETWFMIALIGIIFFSVMVWLNPQTMMLSFVS